MREALKGAKRPELLCGRTAIAAPRLAAPLKPLAGSLGAAAACSVNSVLEGLAGPIQRARAMAVRVKNAPRPSAPLTLTLQGQLNMYQERRANVKNYFTRSRYHSDNKLDRKWHGYFRAVPRV